MQTNTFIISCGMFIGILLPGCQKESIQKSAQPQAGNAAVSFEKINDENKLMLRPGPEDGQDVYIDKERGVPTSNLNYVPELTASSWTINGNLYGSGFAIRFDSLSLVPSTATVISAKLYLYGLSSSLSTPQGDQGDNACNVDRITGAWDETTLTYDYHPTYTDAGGLQLSASTSQWNYDAVVDVTSFVSYFVAHPSENYGFYIHQAIQKIYRSIVFGSSEQSNKNLRPKLVVTYQ